MSKHLCEMNFSYITFKLSSNNFKMTISIVLFSMSKSKIKISKTSKVDRALILIKTYQNILVKKFHDDFDNNIRSRNRINAIQRFEQTFLQ